MAGPSDVEIQFGADAGPVAPAVEGIQTDLQGLQATVAELNATMSAFAVQMAEAMESSAGSMRHLEEETEREEMSLRGLLGQVHEGVVSFNEFKGVIGEVAEAWMAFFMIEQIVDWAKEMGEAGEKIEHIGTALGMTTREVQGFQAMANATGMTLDGVVSASTRLDRALAAANAGASRQSTAFQKLGIDITEARTPAELMNETIAKFAEMPISLDKSQLAAALFGRNLQQVAPLIGLTAEQMANIAEQTEKYGLKNRDAVVQGAALGEAFNENKNAMQGLSNIMTEAFAPVLTQIVSGVNDLVAGFIASYNSGGVAKSIVDDLVIAFKLLVDAVAFLGALFVDVWDTIDGAAWMGAGVIQAVIDAVVGYFKAYWDALKTTGDIIRDVFTLNWGAIQSDFSSGMKRVSEDLVTAARKAGTDAAAGFKQGMQSWQNGDAAMKWDDKFTNNLWNAPKAEDKGGDTPVKTKGDAFGDGSSKNKSRVQEWEESLHEQEVASNDYFSDQKATELAFWQTKLEMTREKTKEWYEVQSKIFELQKGLAHQAYEQQIADLNEQIQESQGNYEKQQSIELQKIALVKQTFGAQSKEYSDAQRELVRMQQQHEQEMTQIALKGIEDRSKAAQDTAKTDLAVARASAQAQITQIEEREKEGQITQLQAVAQKAAINAQLRQLDQDEVDKEYQLKEQALRDELKLENLKPQARAEINSKLETMEVEHQNKMREVIAQGSAQLVKDQAQVANASYQQWDKMLQPIGNDFSQMIQGMINGTKTWQQGLLTVLQGIEGQFISWMAKQVVQWAAHELAKTTATTTGVVMRTTAEATGQTMTLGMSAMTAIAQIGHSAAVAAARAWSALAGIPIIGPALGVAAAAAALAGVLALGKSIFSAEGGWGQVPFDGAQTELHKDEMVLPADIANPLRSGIKSWSPSSIAQTHSSPTTNNTFNYAPTHNNQSISLDEVLQREGGSMRKWFNNQVRNGALKTS